jgi:chromosome segregation ATPase
LAAITDPDGSAKLRNLNASKAALQAFANASPNSNVGKIAIYQDAAAEYYGLRDDLGDARRDLRELDESYDGRTTEEILDDIADLEPSDPEYEATLDELQAELTEAEEFEEAFDEQAGTIRTLRRQTLIASKEAETAFYEASKGQILTPGALAELHGNLGLPAPIR